MDYLYKKLLNGLSLFTGIGGIDVALSEYIQPIAYCEIDPYCQSVLLQRMQEGNLPKAPIWDDVCTLPFNELPSTEIIYGGFPCQGISVAGLGKGLEDERSGLFFQIVRLAKEIKPQFLFLENVPAITTRGGLQVVREIAEMGYDCRWCVISASGVGALHRRERWFLLANSDCERCKSQRRESIKFENKQTRSSLCCKNDSNTHSIASEQTCEKTKPINGQWDAWRDYSRLYRPFKSRDDWQEIVGKICRVDDGVPNRVDRLKSIGNSVVPQQVRKAFEILLG